MSGRINKILTQPCKSFPRLPLPALSHLGPEDLRVLTESWEYQLTNSCGEILEKFLKNWIWLKSRGLTVGIGREGWSFHFGARGHIFAEGRCFNSQGSFWLQIYEYFCVTENPNGSTVSEGNKKGGNIFRIGWWNEPFYSFAIIHWHRKGVRIIILG